MSFAKKLQSLAKNNRAAKIIGFVWGYAEGGIFFLVPDIYITFATLFSFKSGYRAWGYSIAGSTLAVLTIYAVMGYTSIPYFEVLANTPGISSEMISGVTNELKRQGVPYTPLLIVGGIPLKVYSASAFALGFPLLNVLAWTLFSRIVRIAPVFFLVAAVSRLLKRRIENRPALFLGVLSLAWILFYAYYFQAI